MGAAAESAQIHQQSQQQPKQIDACRRHVIVEFPGIDQRGQRQEDEAKQRQHERAMEGPLQVRREEPHQREHDSRKHQDGDQEQTRHGFTIAILCPNGLFAAYFAGGSLEGGTIPLIRM